LTAKRTRRFHGPRRRSGARAPLRWRPHRRNRPGAVPLSGREPPAARGRRPAWRKPHLPMSVISPPMPHNGLWIATAHGLSYYTQPGWLEISDKDSLSAINTRHLALGMKLNGTAILTSPTRATEAERKRTASSGCGPTGWDAITASCVRLPEHQPSLPCRQLKTRHYEAQTTDGGFFRRFPSVLLLAVSLSASVAKLRPASEFTGRSFLHPLP
jgi:hypothetical protein